MRQEEKFYHFLFIEFRRPRERNLKKTVFKHKKVLQDVDNSAS